MELKSEQLLIPLYSRRLSLSEIFEFTSITARFAVVLISGSEFPT